MPLLQSSVYILDETARVFNRGLRLHLISYNCIPRRGGKQDAQPWRKPVFLPSLRSWVCMLSSMSVSVMCALFPVFNE